MKLIGLSAALSGVFALECQHCSGYYSNGSITGDAGCFEGTAETGPAETPFCYSITSTFTRGDETVYRIVRMSEPYVPADFRENNRESN